MQKTIAIVSKRKENQKKLHRHLQTSFNLVSHSDNISQDTVQDYHLIILWDPDDDEISKEEVAAMKEFLNEGKSIAIFGSASSCNPRCEILNGFLLEYGMQFQNDGVVRTIYSKYLHPKHAIISDGILHPSLCTTVPLDDRREMRKDGDDTDINTVDFVYPFGCTVDVQPPSWPILSSGTFCFPLKRPICGIWEDNSKREACVTSEVQNRGRLLAIGSTDMFADDWFDKESNSHLLDKFIHFLLHGENSSLARSKSKKEDVEEARTVPDIEALAERLKWCLHESPPLPQDLTTLFCRDMLSFDTSMIPRVMDLYDELNVKHEPLTLILPEFERPIPPLQPALFQPKLMDLPLPSLDQFDLDEEFAEPTVRLAQLTNKCTNSSNIDADELEYYVQETGTITNLIDQDDDLDAKAVLYRLFREVVAIRCETSTTTNHDIEETPMNNIVEIKRM